MLVLFLVILRWPRERPPKERGGGPVRPYRGIQSAPGGALRNEQRKVGGRVIGNCPDRTLTHGARA